MQLPHGTTVAVADGEKLILLRNQGDEAKIELVAVPDLDVTPVNAGAGGHRNSTGDHDGGQQGEDNFSAGVVEALNRQVLQGQIKNLVVIASPRNLGELRKHYHKALTAVLIGEMDKDLTGHTTADIEKAVLAN
ncbi:protein required for attachment to host cells [Devosia sp. UYZn731]|uniref:host attachment family protein n=1 Tax=Devosia sp. UYZn731 TaxID=3156345 RepID=UPI0033937939